MIAGQSERSRAMAGSKRIGLLAAIAALMVVPVIVIRLVEAYPWDPGDAVFLGGLVVGIALALETAARLPDRLAYGAGVGLAVLAGLLQIWVNLAVGIIGSESESINLIYPAVVAVAVFGSVLAGFRAQGMARAMTATAVAQSVTFLVALGGGFGFTGPITIFFVSLWLICAWLFRRASPAR